mmetsp:Transcript_9292/g.23864  ORF Transcript_9292/g.23864 Transcript_9292/m.23864 type:complete len:216 (+) Transcript_9292:1062-1709(+)
MLSETSSKLFTNPWIANLLAFSICLEVLSLRFSMSASVLSMLSLSPLFSSSLPASAASRSFTFWASSAPCAAASSPRVIPLASASLPLASPLGSWSAFSPAAACFSSSPLFENKSLLPAAAAPIPAPRSPIGIALSIPRPVPSWAARRKACPVPSPRDRHGEVCFARAASRLSCDAAASPPPPPAVAATGVDPLVGAAPRVLVPGAAKGGDRAVL